MSGTMQQHGGAVVLNAVTANDSVTRRTSIRTASRYLRQWMLGVVLGFLSIRLAGCSGGIGAFQAGVGNTPNRPPGTAFRVLGQVGMPFSAILSDSTNSWQIQGAVPLNIILVNQAAFAPTRLIATKQSAGNGILSLQLTVGFTIRTISSTSEPYGTATLQSAPAEPGFAPPPPLANPDVRLLVKGPLTERFSGLFEDRIQGHILSDRAPALVLFEQPNGPVDATLSQIQNLGPFDVVLILNGVQIGPEVHGGPTVTIRE